MSLAASPACGRPRVEIGVAACSADAAPRAPWMRRPDIHCYFVMSLAASQASAAAAAQEHGSRDRACASRADRSVTASRGSRQPDVAYDEESQVAVAVSPSPPDRRAHPARSRVVPGDATRGPQGRARPAIDRPGRRPRATPAPAGKRPPGVAIGRSMPPARPWPSRRRGPASAHHTTCPLSAICARRVMRGASSPPPATAPPWRPPGDARGLIVDGSDFAGSPETRESAGIHVVAIGPTEG